MMGDVVMMRGEDGEDERGGGLYGGWCSGLLFLGVIDERERGGDGGTGSGMGCTVVMGKLARSGDDMGSSCGDGATVAGNPFGLDNGRWLMGGDDGEDERGGGLYGGWCYGLLFLGVIDGASEAVMVERVVNLLKYKCIHDLMLRLRHALEDRLMDPSKKGSFRAGHGAHTSSDCRPWFLPLAHPRVSPHVVGEEKAYIIL
ncbi:hypothetical protein Dimus_032031 [Dionaea muscipula]